MSFALATPVTAFQRQHRRNVETGCRGGTEGGEVTAEECCIAPRCRVEPFLDQGGSAALRRARSRTRRAAALGTDPGGAPGRQSASADRIGLIGSPEDEHRCAPSSSACQCPSHGHRVKGACGVACDRCATLDPPGRSPGIGACEEDGGKAGYARDDSQRERVCHSLLLVGAEPFRYTSAGEDSGRYYSCCFTLSVRVLLSA